MNFIEGKIETPEKVSIITKGGKSLLWLEKEVENRYMGSEVTVGIRPERIIPHPKEKNNLIPATLDVVEPIGETKILTVKLGQTDLKVITSWDVRVNTGQTIWLEFDPESLHVFDNKSEKTMVMDLESR